MKRVAAAELLSNLEHALRRFDVTGMEEGCLGLELGLEELRWMTSALEPRERALLYSSAKACMLLSRQAFRLCSTWVRLDESSGEAYTVSGAEPSPATRSHLLFAG